MSAEDEKIEDLLDEYEERVGRGETVEIERLCQEFPDLVDQVRVRILKLRGMAEFMDDTMECASLGSDVTPSWTLTNPQQLPAGRYRPQSFHARGALGEVFVARDEELDRTVALKRINQQHARFEQNCRRFESEARITGRLEHPGVVPVYGLGRDSDGQPVYAMRFIDGETLADAIHRFHVPQSSDQLSRQNIGFQKLLRRFLSLCQTVAYAHSRHIIHRDIKPANVMLGKFGETLLVDWGLAKSVPESHSDTESHSIDASPNNESSVRRSHDATEIGVVKGSPAYMSPEQADGRWDLVGPPSDIYNLGATLFHLLTGRVPFDGDTADVIERVRKGEIVPAREVNSRVPAALEAICIQAMQHDLSDRYPDAVKLADDIEGWLADEPVKAWKEPWSVQTLRWMRRNRTLVATSIAVMMVLVASLSVATYLLSRKNVLLAEAKVQTDVALETTRQERGKAENSLKNALGAVHAMLVQIGRDDVGEIPEMQGIRREMLEDAVRFLKGFVGYEHRRELMREQALAFQYLGKIHGKLSNPSESSENLRRAINLQQELVEQFPDQPDLVRDLGQSWHELGLQMIFIDVAKAEQPLLNSIELLESLEGKMQGHEIPLSDAFHRLAILYQHTNKPRDALRFLEKSIAIRESHANEAVDENERDFFNLQLAESFNNLGNLWLTSGEIQAAEEAYGRALSILESEPNAANMRRSFKNRIYEVYNGLANLANERKQLETAEDYHQKALQVATERANLYPSVPSYRDNIARSHHNLATVYQAAQRKHDALREFKTAVEIRRKLTEQHSDDAYLLVGFAESTTSLAHVLNWVDSPEESRKAFREALNVLEKLTQRHPKMSRYASSLCSSEINYGHLLTSQGKIDESLEIHQKVIERAREYLKKDPQATSFRAHVFNGHGARANTLISLGRLSEAIVDCDGVVASSDPSQREYWMAWRLPTLAQVDHERAIKDVNHLSKGPSRQPAELYNMVCACALAMHSSGKDSKLDAQQQKQIRATYQDMAFDMLERTFASGFFDSPDAIKLLDDEGFDDLRTDPRWSQLTKKLPKENDSAGTIPLD